MLHAHQYTFRKKYVCFAIFFVNSNYYTNMSKWAFAFRCLVLTYALSTLVYNIFALYLPYAEKGFSIHYNYENLSTYDNLSLIFYKPGYDYKKECENASVFTAQVELIAVQMVIFVNDTIVGDRTPPNILPYITVAFFWSGQLIMLLISILDCFMPCDGSKMKKKMVKIDEYEFGRINDSYIEEDPYAKPSLNNKCWRFFVRILMGTFKIIFVSTTYAIPLYVIGMFNFSTPCLNIYYDKISVFGTWDLLIPYLTFLFVILFSILEGILRCCLHKRMDYYDCLCALEKTLCSKDAFIICCCIPVVNTALITAACAMILSFGFTSILWYKALVSHFPKVIALAAMSFARWPMEIIHILLSPCRN